MLVEGAAVAGCEAIRIRCGGFGERFGLESWTRHLGQGPDNWYINLTELNCEVQKGRNAAPLAGVYKDGSLGGEMRAIRCLGDLEKPQPHACSLNARFSYTLSTPPKPRSSHTTIVQGSFKGLHHHEKETVW